LMPALAREGLDAHGLARLAERLRRADLTIEIAVDAAIAALGPFPERGSVTVDALQFLNLPAEVGLRLLGRAIAHLGDELPVELGKLETLYDSIRGADTRLKRTLAGALVTRARDRITIERAPPRRFRATLGGGARRNRGFTK